MSAPKPAALELGALTGAELLELYGKLERGATQARLHLIWAPGPSWPGRAITELWDAASDTWRALRSRLD